MMDSSSRSIASASSMNMNASRRTSTTGTPLPRVDSSSELRVEPPDTSLMGHVRGALERQQEEPSVVVLPKLSPLAAQQSRRQSAMERDSSGRSPVRRSVVSPADLAKAGLGRSSSSEQHQESISAMVGAMRDNSEIDSSHYEVAMPKKSPLHQHMIRTRRLSVSDREGGSPARHSVADPEELVKAGLSLRSRSTGSNASHSPARRRSMVAPEDLAKAGLSGSSLTMDSSLMEEMSMSAVVAPMRDASDMDSSQLEVALPKKSPLHHHMQGIKTRRMSFTSDRENKNRRLSVSDRDHGSSSRSPVRRSVVDPEDLAKAGLHTSHQQSICEVSPMEDSITAMIGFSRDASERESVHFEVPLPKMSPLHQQKTRRQSMQEQQMGNNSSSGSQVRRTSMVDPEELVKAGLRSAQQSIAEGSSPMSQSACVDQASTPMFKDSSSNSFSVDGDAKVKAGLRNSTLAAAAAAAAASTRSISSSVADNDARIKAGLRNSNLKAASSRSNCSSVASSSVADSDARINKAGLRNSTLRTAVAACSRSNASSVASSSVSDSDTRIKAGLRNSTLRNSTRRSSTMGAPSTSSSSTADNDARIKAGLRNTRMSQTSPSVPGAAFARNSISSPVTTRGLRRNLTAPATGESKPRTPKRGSSDLSAQDARSKAGLRSSITTPTRCGSDLSSVKAGLRSSTASACSGDENSMAFAPLSPVATASTTPPREDPSVRSLPGSAGSRATGRGLRRSRQGDGEGKGDFGIQVSRTNTTSSTSTASTAFEDNSESMRPGAYRASATAPEQPEEEHMLTIERMDSLRKGGIAVLGREGFGNHHQDSFTSNRDPSIHLSEPLHAQSNHFSMISSLPEDVESQSIEDLPFASVERMQMDPKEDEDKKVSRNVIVVAVVCFLVLGVVGVVVGVVMGGGGSSAAAKEAAKEATTAPKEEYSPSRPLEAVFGNLVGELPADTIVAIQFGEPKDPQVKAYEWLLQDPNLSNYSIPQRKQRMALASFYFATNGKRWFENEVESPWLDYDTHECDWFSHAPLQQREVCNITGSVESPLPLFEHFDYLSLVLSGAKIVTYGTDVPNPRIVGPLVPELVLLSSLSRLDLGSNKLRGSIPTVIEPWLSSLDEIVFYENDLTGTIPPSIYLEASQLWLGKNDFTTSVIPPTIGSQLTSLSLTDSKVVGTIPSQLFDTNMKELFLSNNHIEGSIPSEIGTVDLTILELNVNRISSSLPTELGMLTNCQVFRVYKNFLTGTVPSEMGLLSDLEVLTLSTLGFANDALEGTIPRELFVAGNGTQNTEGDVELRPAFPNMTHFQIEATQISGSIPTEVGLMTNMVGLYLGFNQMAGGIPSELGLLTHLEKLILASSVLTSTIPSDLGLLTKLDHLELQENELTGELPAELGSLSDSLTEFRMDDNDALEGTVPFSLCDVPILDYDCAGLCGCDCPCL